MTPAQFFIGAGILVGIILIAILIEKFIYGRSNG